MRIPEFGEKVYIIKKTIGCDIYNVHERAAAHPDEYKYEQIEYKGITYNALVGYYNSPASACYVVDYNPNPLSGDYYMRDDFLTEEQINKLNLPEELFEI
jgi:hypothetical protein